MKNIGWIIAFSLFFIACESDTKNKDVIVETESEDSQEHAHHHDENQEHVAVERPDNYNDFFEEITLDEGKKWKVNEEMKPFIIESEAMFEEYLNSDSENYLQLAADLVEKNSGLISSCTMKGESHNQLHNWLHPHMDLLEYLQTSNSLEEAEPVINSLKASFERFHAYFE